MAKYRIASALSVAALVFGAGIFTTAASAVGECSAGDLETLQQCLDTATTIIATNTITVSEDTTFDFSGKTIETNGGGYDVFEVTDGAKLTIDGNVTLTKSGNAGSIFVIEGEGSLLTLNGGTFVVDAPGRDVYGVYLMSGGKIVVNAGATIDTTNSNGAAIGGNNTTGYMYAVISGGTLRSAYQTVYMPQQVSLDIEEGSMLDGGIVARMGHINMNGGTIIGKDGGDTIENYYSLNNGYPWVADAIMVMGGTYVNNNGDHDNALEINITGGEIKSEDGYALAIYDMGKVDQTMDINISGGSFGGKNGEIKIARVGSEDFVPNPAAGYGQVQNPINLEVTGGIFATEPKDEELPEGYDAFLTEDGYVVASPDELKKENLEYYDDDKDGVYELMPKQIDYKDWWIEDGGEKEGHVSVTVEFGKELIADMRATLSAVEVDAEGLSLDEAKGGEMIGAFDINMFDRDGVKIEVDDNVLTVYFDIDEETHAKLAAYDKLYAVYFENGAEMERFEVALSDPENGYYLSFETPHLSTYAVVGVNEEDEVTETAETPDTGTVTAAGASATAASMMAAVTVGIMTSIVSFAYLIRRK